MIYNFRGRYAFLSNFYKLPEKIDGCSTAEHLFQSLKTLDPAEREKIKQAFSPAEARRLGKRVRLRSDWEDIKVVAMKEILDAKFKSDPLRSMLIETSDEQLVHENQHGDYFWGTVCGQGRNMLGKLLMNVRDELNTVLT